MKKKLERSCSDRDREGKHVLVLPKGDHWTYLRGIKNSFEVMINQRVDELMNEESALVIRIVSDQKLYKLEQIFQHKISFSLG